MSLYDWNPVTEVWGDGIWMQTHVVAKGSSEEMRFILDRTGVSSGLYSSREKSQNVLLGRPGRSWPWLNDGFLYDWLLWNMDGQYPDFSDYKGWAYNSHML